MISDRIKELLSSTNKEDFILGVILAEDIREYFDAEGHLDISFNTKRFSTLISKGRLIVFLSSGAFLLREEEAYSFLSAIEYPAIYTDDTLTQH